MNQIVRVLIPKISLFPLDYKSTRRHEIGQLVVVPFRNKNITGIIWEIGCSDSGKNLKSVIDEASLPYKLCDHIISLIKGASAYYLADLGTIAKLVLPVDINEPPIKVFIQEINKDSCLAGLNAEQNNALNLIRNSVIPTVIKGITGSGKTEIYFHAILEQIRQNKQALIMLPEISLSSQIIARFKQRFGFDAAIWNSSVTKAQKKRILRGIITGDVKIVIGARSSLFLPYKNLGLIVVDEEHDASYKQNEGILYNARDMAVLRAHIEKCKVLLVSATPSIETMYNVEQEKYNIVYIQSRYKNALLPDIDIINMKEERLEYNSWLSTSVINAIGRNIKQKQQTLIFLNRRGYSPLMLCKNCGYRSDCKDCSASMVYHKRYNRMECHHCGAKSKVFQECPECRNKDSLIFCGPGIERIEEEIRKNFPNAVSTTISKQEGSDSNEMQKLLDSMHSGDIDILIGTQIITKGYHFPNLTLVVIVDADLGFIGGDLRASERAYQLLHQVGGRAGRGKKRGRVLIQTFYPEHKVISALANKEEDLFIQTELDIRNQSKMPPYSRMAAITITGKNSEKTLQIAKNFVTRAPKSQARIMGPSEASVHKLAGKYRYKILILASKGFNIQKYLKTWKESAKISSIYQLRFDIDPYNL